MVNMRVSPSIQQLCLTLHRPPGFFTSFLKSQYTSLPHPSADLTDKVVIVTGANVGLGLEASRHFVRQNAAKVILACRSLAKARAAAADIEKSTGRKGVVETWEVDLNSYASVKAFCKKAETLERLDIVVENAGVAIGKYVEVEGMEMTIQTNVIATFFMAVLLLPILRASAEKHKIQPRLVIVASDAHFMVWDLSMICHCQLTSQQASFPEQDAPAIFSALNNSKNQPDKYNTSKLLEVLVVRELAAHMTQPADPAPKIILNCLTPGLCESDLLRHAPLGIVLVARVGKMLLARSTEVGSRTLFAASVAGEETHGKYMADCKIAEPSAYVRSEKGVAVGKKVYTELMELLEGIEPGLKGSI